MTSSISNLTTLSPAVAPPQVASSNSTDQVSSTADNLAEIAKDMAVAVSSSGSTGAAISLLTRGLAAHLAFEAGYAGGQAIDSALTEHLGQSLGAAIYDWTHGVGD